MDKIKLISLLVDNKMRNYSNLSLQLYILLVIKLQYKLKEMAKLFYYCKFSIQQKSAQLVISHYGLFFYFCNNFINFLPWAPTPQITPYSHRCRDVGALSVQCPGIARERGWRGGKEECGERRRKEREGGREGRSARKAGAPPLTKKTNQHPINIHNAD